MLLPFLLCLIYPKKQYEEILTGLEAIKIPEMRVFTCQGKEKWIDIKTQSDFDNIQNLIISAQNEGFKTIIVSISHGPYYYHKQHILLRKQIHEDIVLKIKGNGTKIVSKCNIYDGSGYDNTKIYISPSLDNIDIWSPILEAQKSIEILDEKTKECRVYNKSLEKTNVIFSDNSMIQISQWFKCPVYKVYKIEKGWVYFYAEDLERIKGSGEYSVNYDTYISQKRPVFRLCNVEYQSGNVVEEKRLVLECTESMFLYVDQCQYRHVEISGLNFYGNCANSPFIKLMFSSNGLFDIHDCQFHGMRSMCIYAFNTDNLVIRNNKFTDMYNNVVYCFDHGRAPIIKDNVFSNVGLSHKNTFAITCRGDEGYIVNNSIVDFGYGAISIGHYKEEYNNNRMIIEGNNIYYTSGNLGSPLIDGGSIYLYPNSENCIVRYNRINNIYGRGSNRGIYCDDGAHGFSLYGNIVTNIDNSYCIDSWLYRVDSVNNTNNLVMFNVVDGKCRFEGAEMNDNHCIKGSNLIMYRGDEKPINKIHNYVIVGEDIDFSLKTNKKDKISLDYKNRRILRQYKIFNGLKRYVE